MRVTGRLLCPSCQEILVPVDRDGIEIDYCPHCRGVWLDRGELDKILERASARVPYTARPSAEGYLDRGERHPRYREYDDDEHEHFHKRRKRKSFLEDLFDFD